MHRAAFTALLACASIVASAQTHDPDRHQGHSAVAVDDTRIAVKFPDALRAHTLANMRDHLLALQEIQLALSRHEFEAAGELAERRLGMSSLALHGAHDVAPFMPQGMQDIGTEMHHAASRLAVEASNAGASGDLRPVLAAMARVTQQCVACHAGYRMQ